VGIIDVAMRRRFFSLLYKVMVCSMESAEIAVKPAGTGLKNARNIKGIALWKNKKSKGGNTSNVAPAKRVTSMV
jgi:hypothetical protein